MRKLFIFLFSISVTIVSSIAFAADISPTVSIRYEDFINEPTPGVAIGLRLDIDGDRFTGWEVTTDQENFDTRLLIGWKWGVIGIGAIQDGDGTGGTTGNVLPHYTFGVSYELLDGLRSNFEYVMTPDYTAGVGNQSSMADHLRLALSISF